MGRRDRATAVKKHGHVMLRSIASRRLFSVRILPEFLNLADVRLPAGTDDEMAFRTFTNYMQAFRNWALDLYPHQDGLLAGLAAAVKAQPWRTNRRPASATLRPKAQQALRLAWGTELCLNVPPVVGGELVTVGNLWAPAQAYYAAYHAVRAMHMTVTDTDGPPTHQGFLRVAAHEIASPSTPFVVPWTARGLGSEDGFRFEGFGTVAPDPSLSNLSAPTAANAPHLVAKALKTTRREQIEDHHDSWCSALKTTSGQKRKTLPRATRIENSEKMSATTLLDVLWRLRTRANYHEGDIFVSGSLSPVDAAEFQEALSDLVAATLLTAEVFLAHLVGELALHRLAAEIVVPSELEANSVCGRFALW